MPRPIIRAQVVAALALNGWYVVGVRRLASQKSIPSLGMGSSRAAVGSASGRLEKLQPNDVRSDNWGMHAAPARPDPIDLDALPSMPAAAVRIVGLCDDPDVELSRLAAAVALDPALSAKILRIANSAAYSRGHDVTSIDRAMMLMGIKVVKLTALGFVVTSTLSDHVGSGDDVTSGVWRQCLIRAVACRELAHQCGDRSAPEAFLTGLFDGMGQLLAMVTRPGEYGALLREDPFPGAERERECLGATTSEIVQAALRCWGMPDLYARVLENADTDGSEFDQSEVGRLSAILVLARHATHLVLGHPELDTNVGAAEAILGLADDAVDTIAVDLGAHVDALADTMGVDLGESLDFAGLLAHARDQMVQTSIQLAEETMQQHHVIADLEHEREELRRDARTDRLTDLPNRAAFDDVLAGIIDDRINGRTLTGGIGIAMIDIDHFKKFNDTYGHRVGDTVLSAVGAALSNATRANETIARYGGEEFVLVIPVVESPDALHAAAERIRQTIEAVRIEADGLALHVTVSVGAIAATSVLSSQAGPTLVEAADRLLYQAKDAGRNTVRTDFVG